MNLIGITGLAGSGKDTAGRLIRDLLVCEGAPNGAFVTALADPIREMLAALGVPRRYMTDRTLKELPVPGFGLLSYREMAQTLGTEWGRALDGNLWLKVAELHARQLVTEAGGTPTLIYTDIRFPNEANWIRRHGGRLMRIARAAIDPVRAHASEWHIKDLPVDAEVLNDGSLEQLRARVRERLVGWHMLDTNEPTPEAA